ncbi:MAG TPA: nickel-dependent hydrogenase large subunit [Candidatus Limnocylindrales bacterium]|nr:nickel-dependent hydrogenase large subunit [Candidatus Limnocylindrales bacterium]
MSKMAASGPPKVRVERTFAVDSMSRVEGEGRLRVVVRGDEVVKAELSIFEAPRFFERLVVGRHPDEVLDMVARICGICPVAYQMTAVEGFERLFGVTLDPQVRQLRRLFYWGEWLQSHALHIYLLNAPDFLGYDSAIEMARDHRRIVERGLSLKQAGVHLLTLLGARAVHPVGMRVGGFYRVPARSAAQALLPELEQALTDARETVRWTSTFELPDFERDPLMLSMYDRELYALDTGRLVTTEGIDIDPGDWDKAFTEHHVEHSTALQATSLDGKHHLVGPSARVVLAGEGLHPLAKEALEAVGGSELLRRNMFAAITARGIEMIHAIAEAMAIVEAYQTPDEPFQAWEPRAGVASWSTEAPRGVLFHRYEVDERGHVTRAQIVPPTSQNQAFMEDDMRGYVASVLDLPELEAAARLEALIRCYDPCISCATHFLNLEIERL